MTLQVFLERYLNIFFKDMGFERTGFNKMFEILGRFTRHLNIISIDSFDNDTLNKIFSSITDWHFGSGFDSSFPR